MVEQRLADPVSPRCRIEHDPAGDRGRRCRQSHDEPVAAGGHGAFAQAQLRQPRLARTELGRVEQRDACLDVGRSVQHAHQRAM